MERLKLFVSTPFRSYGDASYYPDAVFGAGDDAKRRYVDAVLREIGAAAADAEGFEVVEVEFGCRPADALDTRALADVVRAVRSHFAMAEKPLVHASSIPGGVTADFVGFARSAGFAYLEVELPAADARTLASVHLPPVGGLLETSGYVVRMSGGLPFGVAVDGGLAGSWSELLRTLQVYLEANCNLSEAGRVLCLHPKSVRYRIDQIEQLLPMGLSSFGDRSAVGLALSLYQGLEQVCG